MTRPTWKHFAKPVIKAVLGVAVLLAVGRHVEKTWRDLRQKGGSVRVAPEWVVAGGGLYLAGLAAFGVYFGQVMKASPAPIAMWPSVRAYVISHLGKYVPGKAMVVVMRVGLTRPYGARPATAALATFYETLVMMAGGSVVATAGFAFGPSPLGALPAGIGAVLAGALLVAVEPRVFPWLVRVITKPLPGVGGEDLPRLSHKLLGQGLLWSAVGWTLLGLSQVAVVRAVSTRGVEPRLWPLVIAGVAMATVAGFLVAVLPGGLGVREGVLMSALGPTIGTDRAVVAALALRLTWVGVEALAATALMFVHPTPFADDPGPPGPLP